MWMYVCMFVCMYVWMYGLRFRGRKHKHKRERQGEGESKRETREENTKGRTGPTVASHYRLQTRILGTE